jgi:hypothetical protein
MLRLLEVLDKGKEETSCRARVTVSMHDIVITFESHGPLVSNLAEPGIARQPEIMIRSI